MGHRGQRTAGAHHSARPVPNDGVNHGMRGRFIVIEGADGTGTTTQTQALASVLRARGRSVHTTAEPSQGPIGQLIRTMLRDVARPRVERAAELALLFAADRLHHVACEVEPALARGHDVISDRYALSSWVYQALDLPLVWVQALNTNARAPDVTILIDVPVREAAARMRARGGPREMFDDVQQRVHEAYRAYAKDAAAQLVSGVGAAADVTARIVALLDGEAAA